MRVLCTDQDCPYSGEKPPNGCRCGEDPTPNPGSDAALAQGCKCPVLDNGHGDQALADDRGGFIVTVGCPLHTWEVRP